MLGALLPGPPSRASPLPGSPLPAQLPQAVQVPLSFAPTVTGLRCWVTRSPMVVSPLEKRGRFLRVGNIRTAHMELVTCYLKCLSSGCGLDRWVGSEPVAFEVCLDV